MEESAQIIMSQYGGPDGEIGASLRYLSQRFSMPNRKIMGVLNDIGTEELAHLEIVSTIVHQLTRGLSVEEIEKSGLAPYYVDHTVGIWPQAPVVFHLMHVNFSQKGMRSPICMRIWLLSKKHAALTITF